MHIHFIGIGGIGVSALAEYFLEKGNRIFGSDLVASEITRVLEKKGARIFIGQHKAENLAKDIDLVIHSPAVRFDNPELRQAKKLKIKTKSYPQALGEMTKEYFTIAVAGTHGKSTTTAMLGILLTKAGFDPTVIVGTKVKEFNNSNCRVGKSEYLVIEACEHEESFLNYWPKIIIITNIEKEHLDYYKNFSNVLKGFQRFVSHLTEDGILIIDGDHKNTSNFLKKIKNLKLITKKYSLKQKEAGKVKKIMKIPGRHNISNALAVLTAARILKIPDKVSFDSLGEYQGTWRRFEVNRRNWKGKEITIINDYAHHPTEIKVTLAAAREKFPGEKIWAVFQPHQYQRTFYLFKDFINVLNEAPTDKMIIMDIYDVAGRENTVVKKKVSSSELVDRLKMKTGRKKEFIYLATIKEIIDYLEKNLEGGEVIVIMGAGDIYKLAENLTDSCLTSNRA